MIPLRYACPTCHGPKVGHDARRTENEDTKKRKWVDLSHNLDLKVGHGVKAETLIYQLILGTR